MTFPAFRPLRAAVLALGALCALAASAQQGDGTDVPIRTHVFKPAKVALTQAGVQALRAPPGFAVSVFAAGLKNARILAVAPDGTVYLSRRDQGDVVMLRDADGDGQADGPGVIVANRAGAHGLAIHAGHLYIATVRELFRAPILADGLLGPLEMLLGDLPDAGQHPNRTMAFGPDGMLYLSVGSTCNACNESNHENAALLRIAPDGKSRTIFASGLRNTIGFDWEPRTGALWGMDHGIDFLGDDVQPEELNRIERGKQYGWPHIWGQDGVNPQSTPVGEVSKAQWAALSTPMVMGYTAHAAPMQMLFYTGGAFPAEYQGDAFVTMRGSWNRKPASGYEIVRIRFADGRPQRFEPFVTGFLTDGGSTHVARPVGLAMARDGALLMADDANGVVYRIAYTGQGAGGSAGAPPAEPMRAQAMRGSGVPLAMEREETRAAGTLQVGSASIAPQGTIPLRHSEYADGVSPQLRWTPVAGAKSYALIMEDPDARPVTPFVHWLAWNIPAGVTQLPEGLQEQLRLTEPEGVLQGTTTRGAPGYYGPKPPVMDPPHRYHFQVFALDRTLELPPAADRDQLLAAMRGHVLAKGVLVGSFQQLTAPLK
ncbi:YbhB/YbcL family Raf kinase inhibitor-like protein [Pseudorhodoferax soli]|uniref:Raf kinase inhibitor-like YbhB/YbcL family protein n=1 Tax=Pseudorhodoferax soli TaxID=545864 RepID=A0A368XBA1_9BURK|nr:YbhB/YbcL family Raf kinase inhibitor-like protein [Pseudorhodoferax soli]RCW65230.1 Raf kinase inhibitor-like YbhB/YbcL family protein [Pseudorhodoferax soli]